MRNILNILIAFLFSSFIYLDFLDNRFLITVLELLAIYLILVSSRKNLFFIGSWIGIFWFYWISFSFIYYDLPYLVPFVIIFFAIFYGLIFYLIGVQNLYLRGLFLILLNIVEPFNFNWFKPQIIFVNSYLGTQLWQFAIIVLAFILFIEFKNKKYSYIFLLLILTTYSYKTTTKDRLPIKIKVIETKIEQSEKWKDSNEFKIIKMNLEEIKRGIDENYEMVVLPESTFPLFLNRRENLLFILKELSKKIIIWTGGLYLENNRYYNASFIFQNGNLQIAKKMVLVPFGEYIPIKFLENLLNNIFFKGGKDFQSAIKPTDIKIQNTIFRNAICYEGTSKEIFQNSPKYIIMISNNGWFVPSIEPILQKLLMQHYSNIYRVVIIHSVNMSQANIIYPN